LVSGGLDSAVAAACLVADGAVLDTLAVEYGQRCQAELAAAESVSRHLGARSHRVVGVDLRTIGGSALTDDVDVPMDRSDHEIGVGVPATYVPARNTILLSLALGLAEVVGADQLVIGANALDYSGYPDCRGPFLDAFGRLANEATAAGTEGRSRFRVRAPLLEMSKAEIVRKGIELGVPLEITMSCYAPVEQAGDWLHCGRCDSCALRRGGFGVAGIPDPTRYAAVSA
jgi:7-cyano-7-deazaguanine synthase